MSLYGIESKRAHGCSFERERCGYDRSWRGTVIQQWGSMIATEIGDNNGTMKKARTGSPTGRTTRFVRGAGFVKQVDFEPRPTEAAFADCGTVAFFCDCAWYCGCRSSTSPDLASLIAALWASNSGRICVIASCEEASGLCKRDPSFGKALLCKSLFRNEMADAALTSIACEDGFHYRARRLRVRLWAKLKSP
jgi:hypothetical protein